MARMVATKTALSVRIDALSDADTKSSEGAPIQGIENRAKLESRLRMLEQGMGITSVRRAAGAQGQGAASGMNKQAGKFELKSNGAATYNAGADTLIPSQPSKATNGVEASASAADESTMEVDADASTSKKSKKDKKRKRDAAAEFEQEASAVEAGAPAEDVSVTGRLSRHREQSVLTMMA